jgi:hypothetical protein
MLLVLQLETLPTIGYVTVTRSVLPTGFAWNVTYSGCRNVGALLSSVCNIGNVPELGVISVTGAGTPTVVETVTGTQTAMYGSEIFTDLSSPQPFAHRVAGLTASTPYYFRVSAYNVIGLGARQLSTPRYLSAAYQAPGAPPAPKLVASSAKTMTLVWEHPVYTGGTNVTGYLLEMNDWAGGGEWVTAYDGTGNPFVLSATITEPYVYPGRRYQFRVRSRNLIGNSPASPAITFANRDPIPPLPPAIPTRDSRTRRSLTSMLDPNNALVSINWDRPDDNGGSPIVNYRVFIDDGAAGAFSSSLTSVHEVQVLTVYSAVAFTMKLRGIESTAVVVPATAGDIMDKLAPVTGVNFVEQTSVGASYPLTFRVHFLALPGNVEALELDVANSIAKMTDLIQGAGTPEVQMFTIGDGTTSLSPISFQLQQNDPSTNTNKVTASLVASTTDVY